jgi:hypothetical protein
MRPGTLFGFYPTSGAETIPPVGYDVSSAVTLTFAPESSELAGFSESSSAGLTFTPASSEIGEFVVSSAVMLTFDPESALAGVNHSYVVSTSCGIVFRARSRVKGKEVVLGDSYRGSAQQGGSAPLFVQARDGRGVPTIPTSQVSARVYKLGGDLASDAELAIVPHARATAVHAGGGTLGSAHAPGRYFALLRWEIAEESGGIEGFSFEVLPGGDPRGPVIAAHDVRRPEARHVLAQVAGGLVLGGRNPRPRL